MVLKNYSFSINDRTFKKNEIWKLLTFFGVAIIAIYFAPDYLKTFFLLFTLVLFIISKPRDDYFWIAIALIFIDNPGNIFWKTTDEFFRISIIEFSYLQLFSLIAFFKTFLKNSYPNLNFLLKKPYKIYLYWLLFLLIEGILIGIEGGGRTGYRYLYYYYRIIIILPLFYAIPCMLSFRNNFYKFCRLIFVLVFINFGFQLASIIIKQNLHLLLGGNIPLYWDSGVFYSEVNLVRPVFGAYINLFSFFCASYFYFNKNNKFNNTYLLSIIIICFMSILITATRGWVLAYLFFIIALCIYILKFKNSFSIAFRVSFVLIPLILLFLACPLIENQLSGAFKRMSTLDSLFRGDLTLGGTSARLTDRHLPVMSKFYERPITGWGFSGIGMDTADGHVGNQTILMVSGLIGYMIIVYIWLYILFTIRKIGKFVEGNKKKSLKILSISLLTLIIIHSTSGQIFGYSIFALKESSAFTLAIYFAMINKILINAKKKIG